MCYVVRGVQSQVQEIEGLSQTNEILLGQALYLIKSFHYLAKSTERLRKEAATNSPNQLKPPESINKPDLIIYNMSQNGVCNLLELVVNQLIVIVSIQFQFYLSRPPVVLGKPQRFARIVIFDQINQILCLRPKQNDHDSGLLNFCKGRYI